MTVPIPQPIAQQLSLLLVQSLMVFWHAKKLCSYSWVSDSDWKTVKYFVLLPTSAAVCYPSERLSLCCFRMDLSWSSDWRSVDGPCLHYFNYFLWGLNRRPHKNGQRSDESRKWRELKKDEAERSGRDQDYKREGRVEEKGWENNWKSYLVLKWLGGGEERAGGVEVACLIAHGRWIPLIEADAEAMNYKAVAFYSAIEHSCVQCRVCCLI